MLTWIIGGLIGLGVVVLVASLILNRSRPSAVAERLGRYAEVGAQAPARAAGPRERTSPLGDRLNRALQGRGFASRIATDLARADLKLTVGEFLALIVLASVGSGLAVFLATSLPGCAGSADGLFPCLQKSFGASALLALGGAAVGLFLPRMYVGSQQGGRLKRFDNQLGDTLNLLVNGLRAGYSVLQAMDAVAREQPPPISHEFRRVVQEMQLGVPLEGALANLLRRVPSPDLDLVVTAINVQAEVGGNLADILETISHTIRERVRIKGEIKVLTAQGMMTGYTISGLPIAISLLLYVVNRPYISEFFDNGICGWSMVVTVTLLIGVGFAIIRKIVDIEV